MDTNGLKTALIECFKDGEVREALLNEITNIVQEAVKKATQTKDAEIETLKGELEQAREHINDLEQYSRRECLNISGIPEGAGENTDRMVVELGKAAGVDIWPADIATSHRVGRPATSKTRKIIVKFSSLGKRQQFYQARRKLQERGRAVYCQLPATVLQGVYVSENLTKQNETVMFNARQLRREGKIFAAWTDWCRMKIKLTENGDTKIIKSLQDLQRLCPAPGGTGTTSSRPAVAAAAVASQQPAAAPSTSAGGQETAPAAAEMARPGDDFTIVTRKNNRKKKGQ